MLLEPYNERLGTPTVLLGRVPDAIAIDTGLVRPDPHLGHLNLSAVFVVIGPPLRSGINKSLRGRNRGIVPLAANRCKLPAECHRAGVVVSGKKQQVPPLRVPFPSGMLLSGRNDSFYFPG